MTHASSIHLWSPGNLLDDALHTPPGFPNIQSVFPAPAIPQFAIPRRYPRPPRAIRASLLSFLAQLVALHDAPPVHATMHAQLSAM
jgi:hypothetical protein